jgi:hypothetical protein
MMVQIRVRAPSDPTTTKGYCLKCDILIHLPSGIAFTGRSEEDTFIGSIAYLLYPLEKLVSMGKPSTTKRDPAGSASVNIVSG